MVNDPSDGPGGISSFKSVTQDLHSQRRLLFFDLSAAASALAALQSDDAAFVVVVIVVVVGNVERSGRRAGLRLQREFGGGTGAGLSAVERIPCPAGGTLAVAALHLGVTGLRSSRRRAGGVRSPASVGAGGGQQGGSAPVSPLSATQTSQNAEIYMVDTTIEAELHSPSPCLGASLGWKHGGERRPSWVSLISS